MDEGSGESQEQQLAQDLSNDPSGQNNELKGKIFSTTILVPSLRNLLYSFLKTS